MVAITKEKFNFFVTLVVNIFMKILQKGTHQLASRFPLFLIFCISVVKSLSFQI